MAKTGPKGPSKWTKEKIDEEAEALIEWFNDEQNEKDNKLFLTKFVISRGYSRKELQTFADRSQEFLHAYNRAKDIQEQFLIDKGLKAEYNPYFTGLTLKNIAGWRDKQDVDHTTKGRPIEGFNFVTNETNNKTNRKTRGSVEQT